MPFPSITLRTYLRTYLRAGLFVLLAGPAPAQTTPLFSASLQRDGDGALSLHWPSQTGQSYHIESSPDLVTWTADPSHIAGDGSELASVVRPAGTVDPARQFWRVVGGAAASALTPIARWDVVPNQRIAHDKVLNIGVVAFSKAGIDRVVFNVSGQGYSGTTPPAASSMTHNEQTNVYEYWVPLRASDFSSSGVFTITATAHGKDGGTKVMETLSFVVDATGELPAPAAWVSTTGSDTSGRANNRSLPFLTPGAAVGAIQAINGGSADGATLYFYEGSYALKNGTVSTTHEWITLTRDPEARREFTAITGSWAFTTTSYMRFKGLTLPSTGASNWLAGHPAILWIDDCIIQGPGRWVANSNPTARGGNDETAYPSYFTDSQIYDVDYGVTRAMLARNITIRRTGNDPFVNTMCIINAVVEDVDPGTTYWHADGYQSWGPGPQNRIIYGYYGTNLHYQGLFMREEINSTADNNAFINMFLEMRAPGRPGYAGSPPVLNAGTLNGAWNHLLIWNCSFLGSNFTVYDDPAGTPLSFADTSFIGNVFYQYIDYEGTIGTNPTYSLPGNPGKNEFLNNHFVRSAVDEGGGNAGLPFWYSMSPDSGFTATHSLGDPLIDLSLSSPVGSFGVPAPNSPLLNRIIGATTPVDALGRPRGEHSDIGALER